MLGAALSNLLGTRALFLVLLFPLVFLQSRARVLLYSFELSCFCEAFHLSSKTVKLKRPKGSPLAFRCPGTGLLLGLQAPDTSFGRSGCRGTRKRFLWGAQGSAASEWQDPSCADSFPQAWRVVRVPLTLALEMSRQGSSRLLAVGESPAASLQTSHLVSAFVALGIHPAAAVTRGEVLAGMNCSLLGRISWTRKRQVQLSAR